MLPMQPQKKSSCKNQKTKGFTLLGVIVAAGLIGVLSMVFAQMMSNAQKGQKGIQHAVDFDILKFTIQMILNDPATCGAAFRKDPDTGPAKFSDSAAIGASDSFQILKIGNVEVAKKDLNLGGGFLVRQLELSKVAGTTPTPKGTTTSYQAQLSISAEKTLGGYGPQTLSKQFFFVLVTDTLTNDIVSCGNPDNSCDANEIRIKAHDGISTMCMPISDIFDDKSCSGTDVYLKGWVNGEPICPSVEKGTGLLPPVTNISGSPGNAAPGKCQKTADLNAYCKTQCDAAGYDVGVKSSCSLWGQTIGCQCSIPKTGGRGPKTITVNSLETCADTNQPGLCTQKCQTATYKFGAASSCTATTTNPFKASLSCTCSD